MNEEQKYINENTDKRLTALEIDVKEIKTTVTEMRIDQKLLIETVNRSNDRWDEFDRTQRKNKNDLLMKGLGVVITVIITYALVQLGLK